MRTSRRWSRSLRFTSRTTTPSSLHCEPPSPRPTENLSPECSRSLLSLLFLLHHRSSLLRMASFCSDWGKSCCRCPYRFLTSRVQSLWTLGRRSRRSMNGCKHGTPPFWRDERRCDHVPLAPSSPSSFRWLVGVASSSCLETSSSDTSPFGHP